MISFVADIWVQWKLPTYWDTISGQGFPRVHSDQLEAVVKKWETEHPRITNAQWQFYNVEFKISTEDPNTERADTEP